MAKAKIAYREEARIALQQRPEGDDDNLPAPPDGGYGWVVVFASFMCNMVVDGINYCFGIFLLDLVNYYQAPQGKIAWVGSILAGATLCVGPLVSALVNKCGCRIACILGAVFAAASFALSVLCPSVELLILVYGLGGGIGLGLMYVPAVVCVGYYFETKRSLATGIAVCGSGVGTFAFAPLATFLVNTYGWKGSNLVLAGISLFCVVFGAMMKPIEYPSDAKVVVMYNTNSHSNGNVSKSHASIADVSTSKISITSRKSHAVSPLSRKDVFYTGSVTHLKEFQSQKSLNDYRQSVHSIPRPRSKRSENVCSCLPDSINQTISQLLDITLLKDPVFMAIAMSNFFAFCGLYVPFVYISQCAMEDGIHTDKASFLISIIGITNTIGRVVCGFVADFPQVNSLMVTNICLVMTAASVAIMPFCNTYASYIAVSIAFGIAMAGYISLASILLVDLLGLEKLTNAFGLMILFRGTAALIGTPLAGELFDSTKSYLISFLVASGFFALSAAISFMVPFLNRNKTRRNTDDDAKSPINRKEGSKSYYGKHVGTGLTFDEVEAVWKEEFDRIKEEYWRKSAEHVEKMIRTWLEMKKVLDDEQFFEPISNNESY